MKKNFDVCFTQVSYFGDFGEIEIFLNSQPEDLSGTLI